MSGICGIFRFDGRPVASDDLDRQIKRLAHRGPDRARAWRLGPVGLAHFMMRVTREDMFDAQPCRDGPLTIVADVRLDNRETLGPTLGLSPEALSTAADGDLILAAWKKWGADCVEHLIGDFAFAVFDASQTALTIVRDHMGQRNIFYHQGDDFFAFATEVKGLWALPDVPKELRDDELIPKRAPGDRRARQERDATETEFEGIRAVPGGTIVSIDADGTLTSRRYWEPHAGPKHVGRDEAYYIATYRKVLEEAVACRVRRAIAPAGVLMGGGFDTTGICALAGPSAIANGQKFIVACSVMPEDYKGTIKHARRWVEICRRHMSHLDVRYVTLENTDIFDGMERAFLNEDIGHNSYGHVTQRLLSEIANAGGRIVMDGIGGDYTVNPRGQDALPRALRKGQFRRFWRELRAMNAHLGQTTKQTLVRQVALQLIPYAWKAVSVRRKNGLAMFGQTMPFATQPGADSKWKEVLYTLTNFGTRGRNAMLDALRGRQNYAAALSTRAAVHGLEFTQPFHDKRVVEFGLAIPEDLWVKNGRTRYLAREALRDVYPPEYQHRRPDNDDMLPDFLAMARRIEPKILAEIDRMEAAGRLSKYFDFPRMRAMLMRRALHQHASGNEYDTQQAVFAFMRARYIEWFRGGNK